MEPDPLDRLSLTMLCGKARTTGIMHIPLRWLAALLITIAMLRIGATFRTFSATNDEASHVGAGLEIIQYHRYKLQRLNPPLPRLIMAAPPYVSGIRVAERGNFYEQVYSVFYNKRKYEDNLVSARVGNLVFLAIALSAVWLWARHELDERAGLLTLCIFSTQPIVLGYCGLATHDAAGAAGFAICLLAFGHWLRRPDTRRALLFGLAYGFAISCKFSNIGYVCAACGFVLIWRLIDVPDGRKQLLLGFPRMLLLVLITSAVFVWASYGFTWGTVGDISDLKSAHGFFGALARQNPSLPLPAPSFFDGLGQLLELDRHGVESYLFGKWSTTGWWWYFPTALALKTTLASLALLGVGFVFVNRKPLLRRAFIESMLAALAVLLVAMPSHLDIGVRYVLPVFAPLSVAAAASACALFEHHRVWTRQAAVALLALHLIVSVLAHPDYFPYFNAFAGKDPSRLFIDSNLDWGQDTLRLRHTARKLGVDHLTVSMPGLVDYGALGFPPIQLADAHKPVAGWIAISDHMYRMPQGERAWWWLDRRPFQRVGKTVRLFHIP